LSVTSEKDLLKPAGLSAEDAPDAPIVVINVPLLRPTSGRIWLSDGSLSINKIVSPDELCREEPFAKYETRPFQDIVSNSVTMRKMVRRCLEVETTRLACAANLFSRGDWSGFLYRITLFDQLAHILGLNFLKVRDLATFEAIQQFVEQLDDFIR